MANYVENDELLKELKISNEQGKATERLWEIIMLIATKLKSQKCFFGYPEDFVMSATMHCISKFHMFDMSRDNPFGYFTQVIRNHFLTMIMDYKWEKALQWDYISQEIISNGGKPQTNTFAEPIITDIGLPTERHYANVPDFMEKGMPNHKFHWQSWRHLLQSTKEGGVSWSHPYETLTFEGITYKRGKKRKYTKTNYSHYLVYTTDGIYKCKHAMEANQVLGLNRHGFVVSWLHKGLIPATHSHHVKKITRFTNSGQSETIRFSTQNPILIDGNFYLTIKHASMDYGITDSNLRTMILYNKVPRNAEFEEIVYKDIVITKSDLPQKDTTRLPQAIKAEQDYWDKAIDEIGIVYESDTDEQI